MKRLLKKKVLSPALDEDVRLAAEPLEARQCDVDSPSTGRLSASQGAPYDHLAMEETVAADLLMRFSSRKCLPLRSRQPSRCGAFKKNR